MGLEKPVVQESQRLRPENSEVFRLICDNRKAQEKMGWQPRHSLGDGLAATIKYIEEHIQLYKADQYVV